VSKRYQSALIYGAGTIAALLLGIWVVLESSLLSGYRVSLVESLLAKKLGYEIRIDGDVGAALYPTVILYVKSAVIPSSNTSEIELAVLRDAELHLSPKDLLRGRINIDAIFIDDLQVNLIRIEDGSANWEGLQNLPDETSELQPIETSKTNTEADDIVIFLLNRTIYFSNIQLNVRNEKSGFEFLFLLQELAVDQTNDDTSIEVASEGSVNGEVFQYKGHYFREGAFTSKAVFGDTTLFYNGTISDANFDVYSGDLEIEVRNLGNLLETLELTRAFEGHATLRGSLAGDAGIASLSDLDVRADLDDGRTVK
jgi:uncharacterized protein involved in outer membrane biogenesis